MYFRLENGDDEVDNLTVTPVHSMPRVMAEEELTQLENDYRRLEASWKDENENFIKFQLIANRDLQLANHVLSDKQKVDLRQGTKTTFFSSSFWTHFTNQKQLISVLKQCDKEQSSPEHVPHSNSLDSIGKKRFILIPDEEYDELKRRINSANHTLHQLEETKKQNQIEVENHKLLSKDSSTLHHQLSDLDCRLDHVMGRVDGGAGLLEPVKTAAFENITLLHKISSRRCQDEIRGVSIILDAIRYSCIISIYLSPYFFSSSKAQDEMSMLRRDKEKLQMNQIQFPSSFNENQKAPNNYNEYIETISRMRTKAQYKYHQLMVWPRPYVRETQKVKSYPGGHWKNEW